MTFQCRASHLMDNRQQRQIDPIFCTKIRLYPTLDTPPSMLSFVQYWHCAIPSFSTWYRYSLKYPCWTPVSLDRWIYFFIDEFCSTERIIFFFRKLKYDLVFHASNAESCSSSSSLLLTLCHVQVYNSILILHYIQDHSLVLTLYHV